MKFLKKYQLFESDELDSHLLERGIDTKKTKVEIDDETGDVYFYLYNLSGQLVGYQKYNPKYPKKRGEDPRIQKYYTWSSDLEQGRKIAVWGLESTNYTDRYLFVTEGLFDAARIQEVGYPAIAVLSNDPSPSLKSWLATLPQKKIVIYDNDKAGRKLIKVGDFAYTVPVGKDVNDLNPIEAKEFIEECLIKSGF